jgi:hypothetical protein
MSTVDEKRYSPEYRLMAPNRNGYRLDKGHAVRPQARSLASWVGDKVHKLLEGFVDERHLGWVWSAVEEDGRVSDGPRKLRFPDVSFVRNEPIPNGLTPETSSDIPPDLAVEVLSPDELASEVDSDVLEYLDAGVALVWVVNPEARSVRIHRRDGSAGLLREDDELSGENVVPGFRCRVADLFPARSAGPMVAS